MTATRSTGLLLATMEPPADIEEEFQDWYDSEHFPERQACPGFLTAHRFVCIDGWHRYLAMVESSAPAAVADLAPLGAAARHVDLVNTYMVYARQAPGAFPKSA